MQNYNKIIISLVVKLYAILTSNEINPFDFAYVGANK